MNSSESEKWIEAINSEISSLEENGTWTIVPRNSLKFVFPINSLWIFKRKVDINGNIQRYKAILVARGDYQIYGINYYKNDSPVLSSVGLLLLLSISCKNNYFIESIDINTAFLYGTLNELIYMNIPHGIYNNLDRNQYLLKLNRSIYGLKQASRTWFEKLCSTLLSFKFKQLTFEKSIFVKIIEQSIIYLGVYVDDILIISNNKNEINKFKLQIKDVFKIKDLGEMDSILGIRINKLENNDILLSQDNYIYNILERFNMLDSKTCRTSIEEKLNFNLNNESNIIKVNQYQQMVGSILYLMLKTRPDLSFSITVLSQFNSRPTQEHHKYVQRILRYIKNSKNLCLHLESSNDFNLVAYADASFAPNLYNRKSISGYIIFLGNSPISWKTKKQNIIATSTMESEVYALELCLKECIWLRKVLQELGYKQSATVIYHDNQSSMLFSTDQKLNARTKHIDITNCFVKDYIEKGEIILKYINTNDMKADGFTKSLGPIKFNKFIKQLNLTIKKKEC